MSTNLPVARTSPPAPIRTDEAALERVLEPTLQTLARIAMAAERTAQALEYLGRQSASKR